MSNELFIPFRGKLKKKRTPQKTVFTIDMNDNDIIATTSMLQFDRSEVDYCRKLLQIIDVEGRGSLNRGEVAEFVALRCPAFERRDELMYKIERQQEQGLSVDSIVTSTFEEAWSSVVHCSLDANHPNHCHNSKQIEFGIEAWMIFCRLISLVQYQEAKRHLLRHRGREEHDMASTVVVLDVQPFSFPDAVTVENLLHHEQMWREKFCRKENEEENVNDYSSLTETYSSLPLPELDLNHSLLAIHEIGVSKGTLLFEDTKSVSIEPICCQGTKPGFAVSLVNRCPLHKEFDCEDGCSHISSTLEVSRSLEDFEWLHRELKSHRTVGGTLGGRIIPPFPKKNDSDVVRNTVKSNIVNFARAMLNKARGAKCPRKSDYTPNHNLSINQASMLERYLNYLNNHPALSTSFPLNAILKASSSGLDAAKQLLDKKDIYRDEQVTDASLNLPLDIVRSKDLSWIRTAAQAAVALKVHGVLNATGLVSASSRLQYASLPKYEFRSSREHHSRSASPPPSLESSRSIDGDANAGCFENAVVAVESGFADDDYDLLPSPGEQDRNIGKNQLNDSVPLIHYGHDAMFGVGGIDIDDDINKLREIIGHLDRCISKCASTVKGVSISRQKRSKRVGLIISELAEFSGLGDSSCSALCESAEVLMCLEASLFDLNIVDEITWQSLLARSAVKAANTAHEAAKASKTADSAKAAANDAAASAKEYYETSTFSTTAEAKTAEARAESTRAHAINATIIGHEAFVAKRKTAMALAHDVRYWNENRKSSLMEVCLSNARSHSKAAKEAKDEWSKLLQNLSANEVIDSDKNKNDGKLETKTTLPVALPNSDNIMCSSKEVGLNVDSRRENTIEIIFPKNLDTGLPNVNEDSPLVMEESKVMEVVSTFSRAASKSTDLTSSQIMTESMQSLVDGLMSWGGRFDPQDDVPLPNGIALNTALEQSCILDENSGGSNPPPPPPSDT